MRIPFLERKKHEDKWNSDIGRRIKDEREKAGLTQEELAEKIYKTRVVVSDMERGRTQISAVDLMDIAYNLEKPIRVFYPVYVPTADDLEDYEAEIVHYLRKIGDHARARKVAGLLIDQARIVTNAMVDTDVKAEAERIREIRTQIQQDRKTKAKR